MFMVLISVLLSEEKMAVTELIKYNLHTRKQPYQVTDVLRRKGLKSHTNDLLVL